MTRLRLLPLLLVLFLPVVLHGQARDDQFKKDAFSQNYNDTTQKEKTDSSQLFSFRQYFGSLAHKRPGQVQNLFMGSTIFVGGEQIYNRQYWKLPIVYGGIGLIHLAYYHTRQYYKMHHHQCLSRCRELLCLSARCSRKTPNY